MLPDVARAAGWLRRPTSTSERVCLGLLWAPYGVCKGSPTAESLTGQSGRLMVLLYRSEHRPSGRIAASMRPRRPVSLLTGLLGDVPRRLFKVPSNVAVRSDHRALFRPVAHLAR